MMRPAPFNTRGDKIMNTEIAGRQPIRWVAVTMLMALSAALLSGLAGTALAETRTIRLAKQFGISYLPLIVMESRKLIEKHCQAAGLGDVQVEWAKFSSGPVMNDALLSNTLDFASGGVTPLVTIWAKTKGGLNVKGMAALNSMPLFLNSINPRVKTIRDFTSDDKIALPAVKVSIQAVTLQMAAEQAFGAGKHRQLDEFTVSMDHAEGMAALLSGTEINAHFTSPPFMYQELENPRVHTVLSSYDVLGGPATFNVVWTTQRFVDRDPQAYQAVYQALEEAMHIIAQSRQEVAQEYLRSEKSKLSVDQVVRMLSDPQIQFSTTPSNTMKYAAFMLRAGSIKQAPAEWKELFFPNVHALPGS